MSQVWAARHLTLVQQAATTAGAGAVATAPPMLPATAAGAAPPISGFTDAELDELDVALEMDEMNRASEEYDTLAFHLEFHDDELAQLEDEQAMSDEMAAAQT